jgi:hypothetical protein
MIGPGLHWIVGHIVSLSSSDAAPLAPIVAAAADYYVSGMRFMTAIRRTAI